MGEPDIDTEELRRLHAGKWHACPICEEYTCDPCDMAPLLDALDAREREIEGLRAALGEAVASFYEPAHPGRPALKAMAWRETVAAWQRTLEASEADRG